MKGSVIATVLGLALVSTQALAVPRGDIEAGREKAQSCAACHGETGNADNPQFPRLAGQYPDYLVRALQDYQRGARNNAIMAGIVADLSEQDMWDLAVFFEAQEGELHIKTPPGRGTNVAPGAERDPTPGAE